MFTHVARRAGRMVARRSPACPLPTRPCGVPICASFSAAGSDGGESPPSKAWSWGWTKPQDGAPIDGAGAAVEIPVIKGQELTIGEVTACLESLGGISVEVVQLEEGRLDSVEAMVFCTGRSTAHLR